MTDADKQRYLRIVHALCGEFYLRCVTPCNHPHCEKGWCRAGNIPDVKCMECSGTGLCWRDDERGIVLISNALREWTMSPQSVKWFGHDYPAWFDLKCWHNRHNQPWCESLEQFVREYEEPVDLSDERELKRLLRECGKVATFQTSWQVASIEYGQDWCAIVGMTGRYGKTESAALLAAVEAMLEGK